LFIKITELGKKFVGEFYQEGCAYPGAKPSMMIGDKIEDSAWLVQLVRITAASLPVPKLKTKKKEKKGIASL
jgi:hypothetical protein